jgi:hypothetical protein
MHNTELSLSTARTAAAARLQSIDWATHQRKAKAIALGIAVTLYLMFLALRGAYRLGLAARALWIKYELSSKLTAVAGAIKSEVANITPLSVRVAEVRAIVAAAQLQLAKFGDSVKAEAQAITGVVGNAPSTGTSK